MPTFPTVPWLSNPGVPVGAPSAPPVGGFQYQDPMNGMGFLDRIAYLRDNNPEVLGSLAAGLLKGDLGSGIQGATKAMGELRQEEQKKQLFATEQNQTKQYLIDNGYTEAEANAAINNPTILNAFLQRKTNEENQRAQAQYATDAAGKWSGNVEWGKTADGRMIPLALDQRTGRMARTDGGDMTEITGFLTPGEAAETKARGKGAGEAAVALPMAEVDVNHSLKLADEIMLDPKLDDMVGLINGWKLNVTEEARTLQSKMDQMTGQAFLNAFRSLRGGGQITESEGFKATLAILRGDVTVGKKAYQQALTDYKNYIKMGLDAQKAVSTMSPDDSVSANVGGARSAPAGRVLSVRPKGQ